MIDSDSSDFPKNIFPWAASLPTQNDRRLAVTVTPAALRELRRGHPWVFDDSVRTISHHGDAGDLAVVFDKDRKFVSIGLWDPISPIRIRMVHHRTQQKIDAAWWVRCLDLAWETRAPIRDATPETTGWRWVNGESDGMGALVIDRYADTSVIKLYSEVWFPWLPEIVEAVAARSERVVLRLARNVSRPAGRVGLTDGMVLAGEPVNGPVGFLENGLDFEADVVSGQKTGHFLDQRENRDRVRALAGGQSVLDVFCCTGGFSVAAAAGGATSVTSVDVSEHALATARQNWNHNVNSGRIGDHVAWRPIIDDAFDAMNRLQGLGEKFGVVIVDPPSFAPRDRDRSAALGAYRRLASLAIPLVAPGGVLVMASCSSRVRQEEFFDLVDVAVSRSGRAGGRIEHFGHAADHAATFYEGEYLKAVFSRLDG